MVVGVIDNCAVAHDALQRVLAVLAAGTPAADGSQTLRNVERPRVGVAAGLLW